MNFTRQRGSDNPSLLDLVFTKNHLEIDHIDYQPHVGRSDHSVLVFDFTLEGELPVDETPVTKLNVFKSDFPKMINIFSQTK